MRPLDFPTITDLFVGQLAERGRWVVANVESGMGWPLKIAAVSFRGRRVHLLPPTRNKTSSNTYPAAAVRLAEHDAFEDGQILIFHFLSSLSWVTGQRIHVAHWSGGSLPTPIGGYSTIPVVTERFYQPYLPDPTDQKTRWALAFYREGLAINHPAYQFLSFFKILNNFLRNGNDQKSWINSNLSKVSEHRAKTRLRALQAAEPDIGDYLYVSGRCAIAHAGEHPTADPEDPKDLRRLSDDLPLIRALAELAIEQEFGVQSAHTVYRQHLYELDGFRRLLTLEKLDELKHTGTLAEGDWPTIPNLSIRLAMSERYEPLQNMTTTVDHATDGALILQCKSDDRLCGLMLNLNFREERLQINPFEGLSLGDDGTEKAARYAVQLTRFQMDYLANGILEVWNAERNEMLSRCDAYLPHNIDLEAVDRRYEQILAELTAEADRRAVAKGVEKLGK